MKLDGVLAIRESWAGPDEPVLLCAGVDPSSVRYDVAGLDWWGRPERGGLGKVAGGLGNAVFAVANAATGGSGPEDGGPDAPAVVLWGPQPDTIATRGCRVTSARSWLVLTPRRLGCVAVAERPAEPEPEKSLFDRVSGIAKSARDMFTGPLYPAGHPVETEEIIAVSEVPRDHVSGVALADRRLPRGSAQRQVHVLRLSFVDGSGVDVVAARGVDHAQRLMSLVQG
ncbi:hypothetical protein [Saccharothrix variisporea]|uniref:Uncharacterized protein n=1 Tax=Saccharothrix variisporea TaxID=543527 RepID=A0A495X6V1_9PSEU|nr:hypothetical protein [Saccharothrix variisporea]RKT69269.1 hypothetical protein DFJ66_2473 [Saccharothrix variisporea]